jgi:hypothetical protein
MIVSDHALDTKDCYAFLEGKKKILVCKIVDYKFINLYNTRVLLLIFFSNKYKLWVICKSVQQRNLLKLNFVFFSFFFFLNKKKLNQI